MDPKAADASQRYEESFFVEETQKTFRDQLAEFRRGDRFGLALVVDWLNHGPVGDIGQPEVPSSVYFERLMAGFLAINLALMFEGRRTLKNFVLRASPGGFDDKAAVFGAVNYLNALCRGGFADLRNLSKWTFLLGVESDSSFGSFFLERFYKFVHAVGHSGDYSSLLDTAEVFVDISVVVDGYITSTSTKLFENPFFGWRWDQDNFKANEGNTQTFLLRAPREQRVDQKIPSATSADAVLVLRAGETDDAILESVEAAFARGQLFRGIILDMGGTPANAHVSFLVSVFRALSTVIDAQGLSFRKPLNHDEI